MSSRPCTERAGVILPAARRSLVPAVCLVMLLAGCASGPAPDTRARTGVDGQPAELREVPPEALTLYEQAAASMASGDTVDAELRFQEFLLQYPNYPGAHVNLAIIFAGRDDLEAAEMSLTDALIIDPDYAPALNQLGLIERRRGNFEAAEAAYQKAIAADPDYALAHYNLGVLNDLYLRRLDDALMYYERYQELAGEDEQVSRWIADLKRRISATQRTANVTE